MTALTGQLGAQRVIDPSAAPCYAGIFLHYPGLSAIDPEQSDAPMPAQAFEALGAQRVSRTHVRMRRDKLVEVF
jgi:hypothetical protein